MHHETTVGRYGKSYIQRTKFLENTCAAVKNSEFWQWIRQGKEIEGIKIDPSQNIKKYKMLKNKINKTGLLFNKQEDDKNN